MRLPGEAPLVVALEVEVARRGPLVVALEVEVALRGPPRCHNFARRHINTALWCDVLSIAMPGPRNRRL